MTLDIGSGLGIDPATAEMVVLDRHQVERELVESAEPLDRAVAAIVFGDFGRAALELDQAEDGVRRDALRGELARCAGRPQEAIVVFTELLSRADLSPLRRAMLLQHLGKAERDAGHTPRALQTLEEALSLRIAHQAPPDQIASSRLVVELAQTELEA